MPGGRLTNQDRRHIASGLAEGLGYAEIARQLGRPTSTISREVTRNGGPDGYRADQAHQATGRRARRRKPALTLELPAAVSAHGRDPEAVRGFVEQFAALMVQTGLPRMAARVLACLVTTDSGALTAAELVQHLRVSPASVSKAIGYLEGLELVRRERDPRRRERYLIDDDVWLRTWMTSARTNAMLADTAQRGAEIFDAATPAGARLDHMGQFFTQLSDDMAGGPTAAAFGDMLTVLAALVHAITPRTVDQLATALDWPPDRVTSALRDAERHPDITDPVALQYTEPGTYTITAKPDRLTTTQREALSHDRM
jgi:DNA-binding transcriptional ArsR family regulator